MTTQVRPARQREPRSAAVSASTWRPAQPHWLLRRNIKWFRQVAGQLGICKMASPLSNTAPKRAPTQDWRRTALGQRQGAGQTWSKAAPLAAVPSEDLGGALLAPPRHVLSSELDLHTFPLRCRSGCKPFLATDCRGVQAWHSMTAFLRASALHSWAACVLSASRHAQSLRARPGKCASLATGRPRRPNRTRPAQNQSYRHHQQPPCACNASMCVHSCSARSRWLRAGGCEYCAMTRPGPPRRELSGDCELSGEMLQ